MVAFSRLLLSASCLLSHFSYALKTREPLQDLVTFDDKSIFVRGERLLIYSGEFHPFRLPVPDLWLDVFQKIKAMGYSAVSFYVDWALVEGAPGQFQADGVFAFEPFFKAAAEAGIYLIARPGPYINAEVSGGGFPGWLARLPAYLRTNDTAFVEASANYVKNIGSIIAEAQITKGGPVIAVQAENEYSIAAPWITFPDVPYLEGLMQQLRDTGIVVPFVNNEAWQGGQVVPGEPAGPDIYGFDTYPVGWNCDSPSNWNNSNLATNYRSTHNQQSPSTPLSILEYQGGAFDGWGGPGQDSCGALVNHEAERLFYKNALGARIGILNMYMTFGGTNWGNLGQSGSYTSYDYGAVVRENRGVDREKYSEAKLIAQFFTGSKAYLETTPGEPTNSTYTNTVDITVTPLIGNTTSFYVVRQSDFRSFGSTPYTFSISTSAGNLTIPQLGGSLAINGRDSKVHVADYDIGGINLVYSTADIYATGANGDKKVLLVYGLAGETHELAFASDLGEPTVEGEAVKIEQKGSLNVVQWDVTAERRVLHYGDDVDVYLLWRNDALNYWVIDLEAPAPIGNYSTQTKTSVIAKAGYLLRGASVSGSTLSLTGDLNATADLEVVAGQAGVDSISFNGQQLENVQETEGRLTATLEFTAPTIDLPELEALDWRSIDTLPEIKNDYDDSAWVAADNLTTTNWLRDPVFSTGELIQLYTPTSLFAADYGFHTGSLIYRGHFVANGNESSLYLSVQGGVAFGHSVWLNETYLGSWTGSDLRNYNQTLSLTSLNSTLVRNQNYVITVLIDHMGYETNWWPGYNFQQSPRGILDYELAGHPQTDVTWKLTGNFQGENYPVKTRGPLNEAGLFAERQGYHLPAPPTADWVRASPVDGIFAPGAAFYTASFDLSIPAGYDVPLSFVFGDGSNSRTDFYRAQLYVNGWQFGSIVNHLGPQTSFAVPEGILNYNGTNYIAISIWAQQEQGANIGGLKLVADTVIQSAYKRPALVWDDVWEARVGAY